MCVCVGVIMWMLVSLGGRYEGFSQLCEVIM